MTNYDRMMQLADQVFAMHADPAQLQVDANVLERLQRIHPATRGEVADADGPIAWVLLIPTTRPLMEDFLAGSLTEQELYDRTPEGATYAAVYLCSVLVLPEHQHKGLAKRATLDCLARIQNDHPIVALFCWPFTTGGEALAKVVAAKAGWPLHIREHVG